MLILFLLNIPEIIQKIIGVSRSGIIYIFLRIFDWAYCAYYVDHNFYHSTAIIMDFPFKKSFTSKEEISSRFARLKEYKPKLIISDCDWYKIRNIPDCPPSWLLFTGTKQLAEPVAVSALIPVGSKDYILYDNLSDYYQEPFRLSCKRSDQKLNSLEYFKQNYEKVVEHCKKTYGAITPHNMRESMYDLHYE